MSHSINNDHYPAFSVRVGQASLEPDRAVLRNRYIVLAAMMFFVLFSGCSGSGEKANFQPEKSAAYFDYFAYTGDDDFYNENPLEKENRFYNPILPGWYSDPSICRNGDDYFLVTSTFSYLPGVPIFHSTDLVNWKQIGHVLDRPSQLPLDGQRIGEGIFAPAISYNPHNQTYYMITKNIRRGNFFVKTRDPFGEWSDPIWLPEVGGIDPSIFFDDDGKFIQSNDNLKSWKSRGTGMWRHSGGNDLAFAGQNGNIMYCTTGQYGFDGVWKTTDRGMNWIHFGVDNFNGAGPESRPLGIYALPEQPDTAWVVISDRIYQTLNGGSSWSEVFSSAGLNYIAADNLHPLTFYVNSSHGVFKTNDGKRFELMPGSPTRGEKICYIEGDNAALYVTKWRTGDGKEGLWKFDGTDWIFLRKDYYLFDVAVHPVDHSILVVTTNDHPYHDVMNNSGIWLTVDGGKSWTLENENLPVLRGEVIRFNPHQPDQVILGTGGRGFFKGKLQ